MNRYNQGVTAKMIIGAETGGQVYGNGRWDDVKVPKIGLEVTLTLGAYQFYGNEGRQLLKMIYEVNPYIFEENDLDPSELLDHDWVKSHWVPDAITRTHIADIISSPCGKEQQIRLFCEIQLPEYVERAEAFGVMDDPAQMMWVEIEHVGGTKAAKRIFGRCAGDYSLDKIMLSLKQDQYDQSSENQAGDKLYWSRHEFCKKCIEKYGLFESDDFVYVQV